MVTATHTYFILLHMKLHLNTVSYCAEGDRDGKKQDKGQVPSDSVATVRSWNKPAGSIPLVRLKRLAQLEIKLK